MKNMIIEIFERNDQVDGQVMDQILYQVRNQVRIQIKNREKWNKMNIKI